jgi:uncharacterized membrane protein YdcZ (DUF606 family)
MNSIPIDRTSVEAALERLIDLAKSDTGQARRAANFLLAWWNGDDHGHFDVTDLFAVDSAVAADITTVIGYLGQHAGAIYIDAFGYQAQIAEIAERWRATPETA